MPVTVTNCETRQEILLLLQQSTTQTARALIFFYYICIRRIFGSDFSVTI